MYNFQRSTRTRMVITLLTLPEAEIEINHRTYLSFEEGSHLLQPMPISLVLAFLACALLRSQVIDLKLNTGTNLNDQLVNHGALSRLGQQPESVKY